MTSSQNKTVSVILPNYNYGHYLSSRIDEILDQTYPISELIILDDASTDNSIEIIKEKYPEIKKRCPDLKIKILVNETNSGNVFSQWQKGIKLATSDYIWIAELDDSAMPNLLTVTMKMLAEKDVVLACANSRFVNNAGRTILKDNLRKIKDRFRRNILVYNTIPNVSAVIFKNQSRLVDFLDEAKEYHLSGDWFFYIKIFETGKIAYSRKVLNLHRLHSNSVTKNTDLKKRFLEMQKIHQYVLAHNLADDKTKSQIRRIEKTLQKHWFGAD